VSGGGSLMKRVDRWPLGVLVVTAAAFVFAVLWRRSLDGLGQPSYDIYGFFYPNQAYAWRSLRTGTSLLWNPYQACGAPFFAMSQVGLLYPPNLLFAIFDREPALLASGLVNLSITGAGTFLLGRGLGLSPLPALCAAFAFQLGWVATWLASWSPIHIAALAWLPVALWRTELLIRRPTGRRAIGLAAVLALAHLPGFYQTGFYVYQLIALRVAWACLVQRADRPLRLIALALVGLAVPFLLDAVQVLPAIEVTRQSLRGVQLEARDVGGGFSWAHLADALTSQVVFPGNTAIVLLAVVALVPAGEDSRHLVARIASLAGLRKPMRRATSDQRRGPPKHIVSFYWVVALVYFLLSLGPGSPLYDLYERLPLGSAFRGAWRLGWVTNFALAVLAGWGAEVLLYAPGSMARTVGMGVLLVGAVVLHWLVPDGLHAGDALLVLGIAGAALAARGSPRRDAARWLVPALIAASCLVIARPPLPLFGLRRGDVYAAHAATFAAVRARLTAQDRVMIAGGFPDFALMPKSSSLFHLPGIFDYDTLASRSYVDFFTYMRTGRRLRTLRDWYWIADRLLLPTMQRRLFDVTAARYLITDRRADRVEQALRGGVELVSETEAVRVYENQQALPRARYVARVIVAGEDDALAQLARAPLDPRQVAWVSEAPRSGFLGATGAAIGSAEITSDEADRVVVRVQAAQPGFLFLADQFFPGWTAEVNGSAAEIVRANVAFRAVEVPSGDSEVVFTYRPLSVRLGALISLLTLATMVVLWRRAGRAPRHAGSGR
jgi:Bacterial membrane protein YfhO